MIKTDALKKIGKNKSWGDYRSCYILCQKSLPEGTISEKLAREGQSEVAGKLIFQAEKDKRKVLRWGQTSAQDSVGVVFETPRDSPQSKGRGSKIREAGSLSSCEKKFEFYCIKIWKMFS